MRNSITIIMREAPKVIGGGIWALGETAKNSNWDLTQTLGIKKMNRF